MWHFPGKACSMKKKIYFTFLKKEKMLETAQLKWNDWSIKYLFIRQTKFLQKLALNVSTFLFVVKVKLLNVFQLPLINAAALARSFYYVITVICCTNKRTTRIRQICFVKYLTLTLRFLKLCFFPKLSGVYFWNEKEI